MTWIGLSPSRNSPAAKVNCHVVRVVIQRQNRLYVFHRRSSGPAGPEVLVVEPALRVLCREGGLVDEADARTGVLQMGGVDLPEARPHRTWVREPGFRRQGVRGHPVTHFAPWWRVGAHLARRQPKRDRLSASFTAAVTPSTTGTAVARRTASSSPAMPPSPGRPLPPGPPGRPARPRARWPDRRLRIVVELEGGQAARPDGRTSVRIAPQLNRSSMGGTSRSRVVTTEYRWPIRPRGVLAAS